MKLQGLAPERPLTHDLFAAALEEIGAKVDRVVIAALAEETYHALLVIEHAGRSVEIDARPSDALALAIRTGGRVFAAEDVLQQAALGAESGSGDDEGVEGTPLESTGEHIVDPRLDVFREFVNSLDIEPGSEGRTSSSGS
jgi:bifunctional DNase/RNase